MLRSAAGISALIVYSVNSHAAWIIVTDLLNKDSLHTVSLFVSVHTGWFCAMI